MTGSILLRSFKRSAALPPSDAENLARRPETLRAFLPFLHLPVVAVVLPVQKATLAPAVRRAVITVFALVPLVPVTTRAAMKVAVATARGVVGPVGLTVAMKTPSTISSAVSTKATATMVQGVKRPTFSPTTILKILSQTV